MSSSSMKPGGHFGPNTKKGHGKKPGRGKPGKSGGIRPDKPGWA